ncbi:acyltransferase, partial [Pseudomonas avellanae BPIC 631]
PPPADIATPVDVREEVKALRGKVQ